MTSHRGTLETRDIHELVLFYKNPRIGDLPEIKKSLLANDQYKPIIVNRGSLTGRVDEVLVGNHTLLAFRELAAEYPDDDRWRMIECYLIDVDDPRAERIVAADNRIGQLGGFDEEILAELLHGFGDDLAGTGYSEDDLADLDALLEERQPSSFFPDETDSRPDTSAEPKPPRLGEDGLIRSNDLNSDRESYDGKGTRLIALMVPIEQFIWAQNKLAELREEYGVETNTDAVLALLAEKSGEQPPAVTSEPAEVPA